MAKAFDSVGLAPLKRALQRIKVPEQAINFLIELFEQRQIRIITAYGLTDIITGRDGIDQGETISPLLWCIFYDPLLCQIQKGRRDYIMEPKRTLYHNERSFTYRASTSAFADDTLWLGPNKEDI